MPESIYIEIIGGGGSRIYHFYSAYHRVLRWARSYRPDSSWAVYWGVAGFSGA